MNLIQLSTLLLVPMFSAQASAQIDTLQTESDTIVCEDTIISLENTVAGSKEVLEETVETIDDNALQVQVKGFLDTYHAVRTEGKADWMASRTRARGELKLEKGAASLFVSLNAIYNGILKERTGLELREAYLAYAKGNLDLRVGRQIVVWGWQMRCDLLTACRRSTTPNFLHRTMTIFVCLSMPYVLSTQWERLRSRRCAIL